MTASSSEEYVQATPEFKALLEVARRLSRGLRSLGKDASNPQPYNRVLKSLDELETTLRSHIETLTEYERALTSLASRGLTGKQRILLKWLAERYEGGMNYTALIDRLSEELGIPSSTIRWNLRTLRESGLIRAGRREEKGIPVELTWKGRMMAEYLIRGKNRFKGHSQERDRDDHQGLHLHQHTGRPRGRGM